MREAGDRGAGVLFSSHVLPEVAEVADRVAMLRLGRLVQQSTVTELAGLARERVELLLGTPAPSDLLRGLPGVASCQINGNRVVVDVDGSVAELVRAVAPYEVQRIHTHEQDLEDVLFSLYRDDAVAS